MDRIVKFHSHYDGGKLHMAPAFYVDEAYEKVSVKIHADSESTAELKFDIFADGVSIFNNRSYNRADITTGVITTYDNNTYQTLNENESSEEIVGDFSDDNIEEGAWLTCEVTDDRHRNVTVQLELRSVGEKE